MENTVNNDLFFVNLRLGFVFPAVGVELCLLPLHKLGTLGGGHFYRPFRSRPDDSPGVKNNTPVL